MYRAAFVAAPESAAAARRFVRAALRDGPCSPGLVERTELVASELVAYGFTHGGRPLRMALRLARPDRARLEISDGADIGPGGEPQLTETGRRIVDALTARWGHRPTTWGILVWCELAALETPGP